MKLDTKTIVLTLSMLLNVLGGTSVVPPLVGSGSHPCPACPSCPSP